MEIEIHRKGLNLFFELLRVKVVHDKDELFNDFQDERIKDYLNMIAAESGTRIIYSNNRVQIITKGKGSTFATNFTHLKTKFSVENKDEFNLISIIIVTYLANVDNEGGLHQNNLGLTYYGLERAVYKLMENWRKKAREGEDKAEEVSIDMKKMVDLWFNLEVKNETKKKTNRITKDKKSRIGLVAWAMSLLRDEGLIYITDQEGMPRAIPKYELFDRLEQVYHHQHRFQEVKELIEESEGVFNDAEN
ncbi:DUF6063 family protein [Shouchella lonarensis]|uniref:Uncharacterized protein n=1 Tax=Shouchella lonarensis TaxID=1464122 RepID=A0A1G6NI31_9BACI|nr:DUF6063 family protein [Shouchella lonarensis]SDC66957.1 hypothetical protein SAMN05421737_11275 [Shouchella lonarensis]